jgi:glycerol-3-phosphate cytidylyltransferase
MKKGFVCGVFDMYHAGHVMMLNECKLNCDYLIVALNKCQNINYKINPGKNKPLYSFKDRLMILESCKYIDKLLTYSSEDELLDLLNTLKIDIRFLGDDYKNRIITGNELNIPLYFIDRSHGKSTSNYKIKMIDILK